MAEDVRRQVSRAVKGNPSNEATLIWQCLSKIDTDSHLALKEATQAYENL